MNQSERYEKAQEITELQERIAKLTRKLGKLIGSVSEHGYTAEVVTSNIYAMLGVNGYSNGYSGDVQRVIDSLYNNDELYEDDENEDESDDSDNEPESYTVVPSYSVPDATIVTVLPKNVYDVAMPFLANGQTLWAVKAIRAETNWYLSEALNAMRVIRSHMSRVE